MKNFYALLLALLLVVPATYAQKGLSLGLNGEFTGITIVNQNIWGYGPEYDYSLTNSSAFGFDVGYNFNDQMGVYSGLSFMTLGQDYIDSYDDSEWERTLRFKYQVIPIMFKFSSSENTVNFIGGIGILFAMMKEAEQTWTQDGASYHETFVNPITGDDFDMGATDVTDRFEKNDIILNLELGARIFIMDELYVDATVNFGYGVKDINNSDWHIPNTDDTYNASHNAYGGFKVGVAYVLFGE
ncbi:MAG: outer membrane beta-barrel protein [Bacteroidales bacterium]|nr:outer membrane beta-barrel protein [Bacteroidales bacterium]